MELSLDFLFLRPAEFTDEIVFAVRGDRRAQGGGALQGGELVLAAEVAGQEEGPKKGKK
jgi:hypothetical protein